MADFLIENANADVNGDVFINQGSDRILQVYADDFGGASVQIQGVAAGNPAIFINIEDGLFTANAEKIISPHHTAIRAVGSGGAGIVNLNVVLQ